MKKRAIPQVPPGDMSRSGFDRAIKEDLEIIMGQRGQRIEPLPSTATMEDIRLKVNELLDLLQ